MNYAANWWKDFARTHENLKHSIAGAGAGIVSSIVTCPLDVVKTRLQNQGKLEPGMIVYRGTVGTLSRIWKEEGIRGLYRGLGPMLVGYLPTWAIYFTVYDYCKGRWTGQLGQPGRDWTLHIASAMTAGAASTSLTNPLWVIKTRFMTQSERTAYRYNNTLHAFATIAKEEGIRGFYKGLGPSLIGVSHVAVQFPLYEKLKTWFHTQANVPSGTLVILLASSLSKMAASTATYPHEVIRTRLQNQTRKPFKYHGIIHAIKVITVEEGIRGFYKGMSTNLIRTVPSSAMTILTYEVIVEKLDNIKKYG
ncbi:mitochondrial carrier domain-containing protein [Radiomyces spectabilis]|uniref:mitochondrial carrier domain-containing protein n=1 Tax=Radiomyces spectabilis TaxID=64574 RepID=UPI00221E963D|nr:mitochondrial carrier domain-containing protein [Radiomyces spectabilis]KAI8388760.1 mitochondrial carrier domain-containing protein [Radiomyces spectabilis]